MKRIVLASFLAAASLCAQPPASDDDHIASQDDPPSRVARLNWISGDVAFQPATVDEWTNATLNYPLTTGDHIFVNPGGRAEMQIDGNALRLDSNTNFGFLNLTDDTIQISLSEGYLDVRLRNIGRDEVFDIDTPNGAVTLQRAGDYRIDADANRNITLVTVRDGQAEMYQDGNSLLVTARQTARFTDSGQQVNPEYPSDDFDNFVASRNGAEGSVNRSGDYLPDDMTGAEDLYTYGRWDNDPIYGPVWAPPVDPGWEPYTTGRWAYVEPWGWTWVDDAPWGFAPFHYGRWIYARDRWGWVPGPSNVRPVYGPAFVAFVDAGNVRVSGGGGGPAIGWFPLGPREVYRPSYAASAQYVRQVNVSNTVITNVTVLNNIIANPSAPQVNTYVNLRAPNAVNAVPPAAMAQAQTVTRIATVIPGNAIEASHIQPYARVAPAAQAMVGPARPAQAKPPVQVETRPVVARNAPPPPPTPVSQRLVGLQQNPGKPVEVRTAAPAAPSSSGPRPAPGTAAPTAAVPPSNERE